MHIAKYLGVACLAFFAAATSAAAEEAGSATPQRSASFGELHLHTAYSLDSYLFGNRNDPTTAYKFAQGEPVTL